MATRRQSQLTKSKQINFSNLCPIGINGYFGDHTCSIKYSETPFAQGADGIKILATKKICLPKYLFYFLKANPVETEGYKRHFGKLKSISISLPPVETQKQIVVKIEEEQKMIEANKGLVKIFEQKIKDKISVLWGK